MSKFYGSIGFGLATEVQTSPGVWEVVPTERNYYGDIIQNTFRNQNASDSTNDDIVVTNRISIVADPYALTNFHEMKYVIWRGNKWKISSIEEQFPRLILTLGGLYVDQGQSN